MGWAARNIPPLPARFNIRVKLSEIEFSAGELARFASGLSARGQFGMVLKGHMTIRGVRFPVVVKVTRGFVDGPTDHYSEVDVLLVLFQAIEQVRGLAVRGELLTLASGGAAFVLRAYGAGEENDLSSLGLPPDSLGGVFFTVLAPYAHTFTELQARYPGGLIPIKLGVRAMRDCAHGLAFLESIGVIVRRGREGWGRGSPSICAADPRTSSACSILT